MAVALCVARATENLGRRPEKITVMLSANILKNAMGVGIPGTGMIGLPIAIALGAHQPGEQGRGNEGNALQQQDAEKIKKRDAVDALFHMPFLIFFSHRPACTAGRNSPRAVSISSSRLPANRS